MKFTKLSAQAQLTAIKGFIIDAHAFNFEELANTKPHTAGAMVYTLLIDENDKHDYDENGIVIAGMY